MKIDEFILPNEEFQTSINIDYDFGNESKVKSLVMTDSVCRYMEELLHDVITPSRQRAKLLVGAYGKGKSHIILAALHAMDKKNSAACKSLAKEMRAKRYKFADTFDRFAEDGARLLPVVISGNSTDLQRGMLYALRNALKTAGMADLMPCTNYDAAKGVMTRWKEKYPTTFAQFELCTGENGDSIIERLGAMDSKAYRIFVSIYPELTAGSKFDELDGANAINVFNDVLKSIKPKGYSGIYVVYDEFSKYLESSISDTSVGDIRFLQDFAETCNRSQLDEQLHLLLISHKSLENYIDTKLTKEKADGWRGVSGRFKEIVMADDFGQYYELIERAITKDSKKWKKWLKTDNAQQKIAEVFEQYKNLFVGIDEQRIAEGCYPLHPVASYILPRISERVAQNERTLFTYLCGTDSTSFSSNLNNDLFYVMPDQIYDYFESQLRKEFYTSPLHKIYELARTSLSRVETNSLEARIIKTIAIIEVISQYDRLPPTRTTIIELFKDAGHTSTQIINAIDNLVEQQSIVYLRRSNSYLKLKESSGIAIDAEISERAETIKRTKRPVELLNELISNRSLYPSRYNDEHWMIRFFTCQFKTLDELNGLQGQFNGDGEVIAILPETAEEHEASEEAARRLTKASKNTVAALLKDYVNINEELYQFEAAKQLKNEAAGDTVLAEEYEIAIEDLSEIVDEYVAMYFQPELSQATYVVKGRKRNNIQRKHQLSEILSTICDDIYPDTPIITSEALNKHELTGTAFSSRSKILKAICAWRHTHDFDFVGNGQETSMMRSALAMTGLIDGEPKPKMKKVLRIINQFVVNAHGDSFKNVYDKLVGPDEGIGMRRGPIPIYLAWVIKDHVNELKFTHKGEERPFTETLFDDISRCPEDYEITRVNWTQEMADYTERLAELFGCDPNKKGRNDVAEAIRRWYIGLPQITRIAQYDHSKHGVDVEISKTRNAFFKAIKKFNLDADMLLYKKIPKVFGATKLTNKLVKKIAEEKKDCDEYLGKVTDELIRELIELFEPEAPEQATLGSVLHSWIEDNPVIQSVVFNGVENQVVKAILQANGDDTVTISRLAKAATALRIEDWNDERFDDFKQAIRNVKQAGEGNEIHPGNAECNGITIAFFGDDGQRYQRSFTPTECSKRADMLHSQIVACLADMGGSMRVEEKRQVVFDVLKELC